MRQLSAVEGVEGKRLSVEGEEGETPPSAVEAAAARLLSQEGEEAKL